VLSKGGNAQELANLLANAYLDRASAKLRDGGGACTAAGTGSPVPRPAGRVLRKRAAAATGIIKLATTGVLDPVEIGVGGCVY
jgi:hypothetical protein